MYWFLYDRDLRQERIKRELLQNKISNLYNNSGILMPWYSFIYPNLKVHNQILFYKRFYDNKGPIFVRYNGLDYDLLALFP